MADKLDVGKALDKMLSGNEPKSRMALLDEKNRNLEEERQRLRAQTLRLRRGAPPGPPKRD